MTCKYSGMQKGHPTSRLIKLTQAICIHLDIFFQEIFSSWLLLVQAAVIKPQTASWNLKLNICTWSTWHLNQLDNELWSFLFHLSPLKASCLFHLIRLSHFQFRPSSQTPALPSCLLWDSMQIRGIHIIIHNLTFLLFCWWLLLGLLKMGFELSAHVTRQLWRQTGTVYCPARAGTKSFLPKFVLV